MIQQIYNLCFYTGKLGNATANVKSSAVIIKMIDNSVVEIIQYDTVTRNYSVTFVVRTVKSIIDIKGEF